MTSDPISLGTTADRSLEAGAGRSGSPASLFDIGGIRAVTIERKRAVANDWGLKPLLADRKQFKAIWIPVGAS